MLALRARRGAIAILTVLLFLALMVVGAVVLDFARVELMRNQLQTAADAAALAGAVQLTRTTKTEYLAQAKLIGQSNPLFNTSVVVPDSAVEVGHWDPDARTFSSTNSPTTADAVRVTLRHKSSYLIANVLGWAAKPVAAQAVAWGGPSVGKTECMKPWALWYGLLKAKIDTIVNRPTAPNDSLLPSDLDALRQAPESKRTFNVFLGNLNEKSEVLNSGDFYAVDLPPVQYADGTTGVRNPGGNAYGDALAGVDKDGNPVCYSVGSGDILQTEPGKMIQQTNKGVIPNVCATVAGAECLGPDGNNPVIKSAFWTQATNKGNGRFDVVVNIIGSFVLKTYDATPNSLHVTGVFQTIADNGPIGTQTTTLVRVVLVK